MFRKLELLTAILLSLFKVTICQTTESPQCNVFNDPKQCCNGTVYDTATSFCYNNVVYLKSAVNTVIKCGAEQQMFGDFTCCGGSAVEADGFKTLCCENKVIVNNNTDFMYPECCGSIMIYRSEKLCCQGKSYDFTATEFAQCCGDKKYDGLKEICTDGAIQPAVPPSVETVTEGPADASTVV